MTINVKPLRDSVNLGEGFLFRKSNQNIWDYTYNTIFKQVIVLLVYIAILSSLLFGTVLGAMPNSQENLEAMLTDLTIKKQNEIDQLILNLTNNISSKEEDINEYGERFERYEALGNDSAANSELGKKQQAQRERDLLKALLLQRQDEKILRGLITQILSDEKKLVDNLLEKLMYYARNTPDIEVDENTKIAILTQALRQSMSVEIDILKGKISAISTRLKTVNHDRDLYRFAKRKIRKRLHYIKGERRKLTRSMTVFKPALQHQVDSGLYEMTEGETLNEFEARIIDSIESSLFVPSSIYNEKAKVAQSQWKNLINRVIAEFSFSHVDFMPIISSESQYVMLNFFTSLSSELARVNGINAAKSHDSEKLLNDIYFTLQRYIDGQVLTLDIINNYKGSPRPSHHLFDTYRFLSIASFQSMGPFETLYSQKNKPDIFRIFPTDDIFSNIRFNHAYHAYKAGSSQNISEYQTYFSAFIQADIDLNRFSLDELVKAYEISAFFNDNQGEMESRIDFHTLAGLFYLYEKFSFELHRVKSEEELGIERNIVRYFEGLKEPSMSIDMQLSATDTLAVIGSHVEVSLIALIEGDIPLFIVDKIEQPNSISDEIWDDILSGELYDNMQEEYHLQNQRIKDIDNYIKKTEEIIKSIESPEEYIRKKITTYSSLNPQRYFRVSIINRPPDRLRGNVKEQNKYSRAHPPTVKHFTVYDIITGKAEHELKGYRLTDLIIDWEENTELANLTQHRDWIINGYSGYIDSINRVRIDNYFTLLHQVSREGKFDINQYLDELKQQLEQLTYTSIELDINFGLEVVKQVSSVFDYAFPVSGFKSYLLSLCLQVGTSLLQAENASSDIEQKSYRKEALNNFIYSTVMSLPSIVKSVSPIGIKGAKYVKLGAVKLHENGGFFINASSEVIHLMSASIKEGKGSLFRYNFKNLQRVNGQIGIPMGPIKLPIISLIEGDISPLRGRGGLHLIASESTPINFEFNAVRIDSQFDTGMVPFEYHDVQFRGKINTFTGDKIQNNSITRAMKADSQWRPRDMQVIHVANGDQGTVAIKIPLANITEGKPVLITVGTLSDSTTVYAKDSHFLYVYHTGKNDASSDWKTASDGVETLYRAHSALKEGRSNHVGKNMNNSHVPSIFSANSLNPYQQSTITYHGKIHSIMPDTEYTQTIFNYNDVKAPFSRFERAGYSYALLSRSNGGKLKIATSSEDLTVSKNKVKSLKYKRSNFESSATEVADYLSLKTVDKWKKTIKRKNHRKLDLVEVTRLLDKADYYSPQPKLKAQLKDMLMDPKFDDSVKISMKEIMHTLRHNEPFTSKMIDDYVDHYSLGLFPLYEGGDLSILRVRELRIKMLKQSMKEQSGYSPYKLAVQGGVEGLTIKGVNQRDKQWIGRGECEKASMFFTREAGRREIRAGNNGSTITWNHFYNPKSDGTWIDSTWKQFFELSDTRGKPPIFEGSIQDFRNLGLPEKATYQYLLFLNKIKGSNDFR